MACCSATTFQTCCKLTSKHARSLLSREEEGKQGDMRCGREQAGRQDEWAEPTACAADQGHTPVCPNHSRKCQHNINPHLQNHAVSSAGWPPPKLPNQLLQPLPFFFAFLVRIYVYHTIGESTAAAAVSHSLLASGASCPAQHAAQGSHHARLC